MIVVAAYRAGDTFRYQIARSGGDPTTTDYAWEAAEILRELGVEDPLRLILEAQKLGAAIFRQAAEWPVPDRGPGVIAGHWQGSALALGGADQTAR